MLRSRHGGWQGYIAELLDDTVAPIEVDLLQNTFWIIKFIADWIFLKDAQSWLVLARLMKLPKYDLRRTVRENCQVREQIMHGFLMYYKRRRFKDEL